MENKVNKIKVLKVNEKCISCGMCMNISPDVFEFSKDGLSQALKLDNYEGKNVEDSINACPVEAIYWE